MWQSLEESDLLPDLRCLRSEWNMLGTATNNRGMTPVVRAEYVPRCGRRTCLSERVAEAVERDQSAGLVRVSCPGPRPSPRVGRGALSISHRRLRGSSG